MSSLPQPPRLAGRFAAALIVCALAACGVETNETRTSFELQIGATSASRSDVLSDDGYRVTFDEATLWVGPIRFYSGDPLFARAASRAAKGSTLAARIATGMAALSLGAALLDTPSAHAHPGHYQQGDTLAEWLATQRVDLLASTPVVLGRARGVTGDYRSMSITLTEPAAAASSSGQTLGLAFTAEKDGRVVRARADFNVAREVSGVAVDPSIGANGAGVARVEVDLAALVARIDFAGLPASDPAASQDKAVAAHTPIDPESQAQNALSRGVISTDAFGARWLVAQ
jgi:hypothetical protein